MQFKNKCQMIGSKHALVKEFENTYIKGIPEQKHKWADKKLGKWDFYPSTNLSIHFTGDFTVKVFPLQGLYPQSYIQWHIQQKGQIQMTHNRNILQAYLKFIESNCKRKNRPSKWPALVNPFNEENYSHHSKC